MLLCVDYFLYELTQNISALSISFIGFRVLPIKPYEQKHIYTDLVQYGILVNG